MTARQTYHGGAVMYAPSLSRHVFKTSRLAEFSSNFDISGFSIAKTLCSDTRRYRFRSEFRTVYLGLRLADVEELDLEAEPVSFGNTSRNKIRDRLKRNGAADGEIVFLMEGQRVELNAMTSDQFVDFVEDKLVAAGIEKIVPPKDQLPYHVPGRG